MPSLGQEHIVLSRGAPTILFLCMMASSVIVELAREPPPRPCPQLMLLILLMKRPRFHAKAISRAPALTDGQNC